MGSTIETNKIFLQISKYFIKIRARLAAPGYHLSTPYSSKIIDVYKFYKILNHQKKKKEKREKRKGRRNGRRDER